MFDDTPLIDIKPFYTRYDNRLKAKIGLLERYKKCPLKNCVRTRGSNK
jgi:tRNA (Thr-GGU) A37 N-methylase